jgi:hypothetical protein
MVCKCGITGAFGLFKRVTVMGIKIQCFFSLRLCWFSSGADNSQLHNPNSSAHYSVTHSLTHSLIPHLLYIHNPHHHTMRLPLSEDVLYRLIIIVFLLFYSTYFILRSELQLPLHYSTPTPSSSASSGSSSDASDSSSGSGFGSLGSSYDEKFTIRVNTFRRNDLLEAFLFHYTTCSKVTHSLTHSFTHSSIHPPILLIH